VIASNLRTRARRRAPAAAPGRAVLATGAVALCAAGLAACSSSSAPKAGPSASASATSAAPATSAPSGTASAASSPSTQVSGPDVCSAVTPAQIAAITKDVVEVTVRGQLGSSATCSYTLSDSVIQVQVTTAAAAAGYPVFSQRVTDGAVPAGSAIAVPGLGEQSMASTVGVTARTARWAVLVLNQRGTVTSQLSDDVAIAKAALSGLG